MGDGYYVVEFPPYDEPFGRHFLCYSSKRKQFEMTSRNGASIFAWYYLYGDEFLGKEPDSFLMDYISDKEYRVVSVDKGEFRMNKYRGQL